MFTIRTVKTIEDLKAKIAGLQTEVVQLSSEGRVLVDCWIAKAKPGSKKNKYPRLKSRKPILTAKRLSTLAFMGKSSPASLAEYHRTEVKICRPASSARPFSLLPAHSAIGSDLPHPFKWLPSMGLSCWVPISGRRDKATAIEKDVEIQKYSSFYTPIQRLMPVADQPRRSNRKCLPRSVAKLVRELCR